MAVEAQTLEDEGVESFHLYTLNQARLTQRVFAEIAGQAAIDQVSDNVEVA